MTTEEFKKLALLKNNFYKKGGFEIIGEYKDYVKPFFGGLKFRKKSLEHL